MLTRWWPMTFALLSIAILLAPVTSAGDDVAPPGTRDFRPALPATGPGSLVERLDCPAKRKPGASAVVSCMTRVTRTGAVDRGDIQCFVPWGTQTRFADHMTAIVRDATFTPAQVDGSPVPVRLQIAAIFAEQDGRCSVWLLPNSGLRDPEMGFNYVAPQEVVTDGSWLRRTHFRKEGSRYRFGDEGATLFRISVRVSESGMADDARIHENASFNFDAAAASKGLERARFIPGFYLGRPRPMRYEERVTLGP